MWGAFNKTLSVEQGMINNRAFALLMSLTLLSGCSESIEERLAPDPQLQENQSQTTTSEEIPETTTPAVTLSENIPESIPLYSPVEVVTQEIDSQTRSGSIELLSEDSLNLITQFYQQQLSGETWEVTTPFAESEGQESTIKARSSSYQLTVTVSESTNPNNNSKIRLEYQPVAEVTAETTEDTPPSPANNNTFSDLEKTPEPLESYVRDVSQLGVLTPLETENEKATDNKIFAPNEAIDRRTFARWLFQANNQLYQDRPSEQIRAVEQAPTPAFQDISPSDPDFPIIQGLAEAGIIPSRLTGDATVTRFRPDAPLTRETLLLWKVPLDSRQSLPTVEVNTIQETWGFQDAGKISPEAMSAVVADFSNGNRSNIRRLYGYTQLLQPEKAVTRAEAAAALWSFGTKGEAVTAKD